MNPLVTVFIPVYNCEKYIRKCLDSIINQTYKNLEILIIDDGSTDNSVSIIEQYNDSRIRLLKNNCNKGIPYTRNRGIEEMNGKYLAIMDADDIAFKHRIKKQVSFMEKNTNILALGTFYEFYRGIFSKKVKEYKTSEEIKIGLLFQSQLANPTVMIRNTVFSEYGIKYNEDCFVAQDYELWTQIVKVGDLAILPKVLHKYRWGHENITKKTIKENQERRNSILSNIKNNMLDYYNFQLSTDEKRIYNNIFGELNTWSLDEAKMIEVKKLLDKLYIMVQDNDSLEYSTFCEIINNYLLKKIMYSNNNLKEKKYLYTKLIKHKKLIHYVDLYFNAFKNFLKQKILMKRG